MRDGAGSYLTKGGRVGGIQLRPRTRPNRIDLRIGCHSIMNSICRHGAVRADRPFGRRLHLPNHWLPVGAVGVADQPRPMPGNKHMFPDRYPFPTTAAAPVTSSPLVWVLFSFRPTQMAATAPFSLSPGSPRPPRHPFPCPTSFSCPLLPLLRLVRQAALPRSYGEPRRRVASFVIVRH